MTIKESGEDRAQRQGEAEPMLAGHSQQETGMHTMCASENPNQTLSLVQQALAESRKSEQLLAGLIESAMDAIICVDETQHIALFNPAAERTFGLSAAEAIGQHIERFIPQRFRSGHAGHIETFAGTRVSSRTMKALGTSSGLRSNGEEFPIEASISQIEAQGRRMFTVILRDVTERKQTEQALRDNQADLNRAQSVGQIGSWRLNIQRNELHWSDESYRIFGVAEGTSMTYETFLSIVHPDDREYVDRMWMAALRGAPYDVEHRLVVHGTVKWVRERAELEFDEQGALLGGFGTAQDITELKRAEQALIEADRRKDEFLAMLAHELRNPLTPIRNAAHVLGRLETQEPRVQWAQKIIERQVGHLSRLVDDLLDVSRIVRDKVTLKMESIELAAVINRALDMARPLIDAMRHRIEIRLPGQPVWLEGDPVRLAQVLLNLIDNAAKYTPEGGTIEVEASVAGPVVEIKVRDNGMGIPEDLLPQVFELFQQGERTLDRSQGGLGIGLTLVKRLVEMHGGLVVAHSAGTGQGSEFTIWLPAPPKASAMASQKAEQAKRAATPCRVLVVDDDPAVADSMTVLLQIDDHDVRTAASGEAALELARGFRPQLVLLDIGLQGMDGYEVARRLRAQQAADEKLCLVAVTGYGHEDAQARSAEAGFDRHLVKPVNPETIFELLADIGSARNPEADQPS